MGEGEGESAAEEGAASWAEGALPLAEGARFRCAGAAGPGCAATGDMRLTLGLWTSTPARERVGLGVAGLAIACACLLPLAGAWSVEGGTWCKGRPGERREARGDRGAVHVPFAGAAGRERCALFGCAAAD